MEHPIIYTDSKSNKYFTNLKKHLHGKNIQEEENKEVLDLFQDYCLLQIQRTCIPQQTKLFLLQKNIITSK